MNVFRVDSKFFGGRRYEVPGSWAEVTQEQLVLLCALQPDTGRVVPALMKAWMGMEDAVADLLLPADWYAMERWFAFALHPEGIDRLIVRRLEVRQEGLTLLGPSDGFDGLTWEEFVYADSYAEAGLWEQVAAVLYRPERADWDGESDRRVAFSRYGAGERVAAIRGLDRAVLDAVALNYRALRLGFARRWPRIFQLAAGSKGSGAKGDLDAVDAEGKADGTERRQGVSWLTVSRHLLSDHFYEEGKLMGLSVGSVMFQLNEAAGRKR